MLGWIERFQLPLEWQEDWLIFTMSAERVSHCNVKPENILLDCNYETKISDFELTKLPNRKVIGMCLRLEEQDATSHQNGHQICRHWDVYSYGVVLLELMSGSRVSDMVMKEAAGMEIKEMKRMYLMLMDSLEMRGESWIASFIDSKLKRNFACKQAVRMVKVAISCLEEERNKRPNMEEVVQMLLSSNEKFSSDYTSQLKF